MIVDHSDRNERYFQSIADPVRRIQYMIWFLSCIGHVPTPNVCLDVWDCVESYAIRMLLTCRLRFTFTPRLKLIISFLYLHTITITFSRQSLFSGQSRHTPLPLLIMLYLQLGAKRLATELGKAEYLSLANQSFRVRRSPELSYLITTGHNS